MNINTPMPQSGRGKVAIPRIHRHAQLPTKDRRRVTRACTACRNHKIKCTGDTPRCKHCESTNRDCVYILPRKDRLKIITERCVQMAALLSALRGRTDDEEDAKIGELLDAVEDDLSEIRQTPVPPMPDAEVDISRDPKGVVDARSFASLDAREPTEPLEPLDTESMDLLDEDLLKDDRARATGFIGKNSELQWLRSIMLQLERDDESTPMSERRTSSYGVENIEQVSAFNFYLNAEGIDPDFVIDPYELPIPETAERLLNCYMETVHDSFPILPKEQFEDEFQKYFKAVRAGNAPRLSPKWQAILNLVFAIAAKNSHLVKARWRADERDHIIYQARARVFGLNEFALTSHPDVPQIQVAGMLAFYYLSVGQISRAWIIVGVALRFAFSLGLHVRNEDPSASPTKKEMLVRIWWSLYCLERLLSIITGRPSIIVDSVCSVPLPAPFPADHVADHMDELDHLSNPQGYPLTQLIASSSVISPTFPSSFDHGMMNPPRTPTGMGPMAANSESYFKATVQLGIITQNILTSLYSAGTMIRALADIQQDMIQLSQRLDQWVVSMPSEFNFKTHNPRARSSLSSSAYFRERVLLGFNFCSARILLTRPCLFALNHSQAAADLNIPTTFIRRMADVCVDAAKTVANFLPEQPNALFIYENGPWWCIVHSLMQTASVFLLALSYSVSGSQEVVVLLKYAKKLVRWLRMMKDPLAERAYQMALSTLEAVAGRLSLDISDLWIEDAMVFPASSVRGTQAVPYGAGRGRLPDDAHAAASMFTSFDPMPASNYPQQDHDPSFGGPYFHNN